MAAEDSHTPLEAPCRDASATAGRGALLGAGADDRAVQVRPSSLRPHFWRRVTGQEPPFASSWSVDGKGAAEVVAELIPRMVFDPSEEALSEEELCARVCTAVDALGPGVLNQVEPVLREHVQWSLFVAAAGMGFVTLCRLCLELGAAVESPQERYSAFWAACRFGQFDCACLCIRFGANVNFDERVNGPPLAMACRYGHLQCARLCLDHGADVDKTPQLGDTALSNACFGGHLECARLCLRRGADVNFSQQQCTTPLFASACGAAEKCLDCALLCLEHGADVERGVPRCGDTPLWVAAQCGRANFVRLLLQRGADPSNAGFNKTPAQEARVEGHYQLADILELAQTDREEAIRQLEQLVV